MLVWDRRSALSVLLGSSSLLTASFPPTLPQKESLALICGGFLMTPTAYQTIEETLIDFHYTTRILAYNDPLLKEDSTINGVPNKILPPFLSAEPPEVLVGHSKGAKSIAGWMPLFQDNSPVCVLIEPVDVNPPRSQSNGSVLELWKHYPDEIARTPTLIVSAPYTQTSRRYGKAANLCAPAGKDARAFYETALAARRIAAVKEGSCLSPLVFCELPGLGHNDIVSTMSLGGCADGPDQALGAAIISLIVSTWLQSKSDSQVTGTMKETLKSKFPQVEASIDSFDDIRFPI